MVDRTPTQGGPRAHFLGIGGTGMVAVARLALEAGWDVRGSDNPLYPPTSEIVKALGVPVAEAYASENLDWDPDVVVVGNALSRGNVEVEALLERRLPYVSFPEWLRSAVLHARRPVVIAGTHGKTTTTALTSFLLDSASLHPGYLIGGGARDFPYPSRLGETGGPFIVEGDEYDSAFFDKRPKFLHYAPHMAVVTSVEFDHADIYDSLDAIEAQFRLMLRQIPRSGHLILCADSPGALALSEHAFCNVVTYGFSSAADWRVEARGQDGTSQEFLVFHQDGEWGRFQSPLFGRHNMQNAVAAIIVASLHNIGPQRIAESLQKFSGVRRRMEIFLESDGIVFVDDFAHHPTAIRETIAAAKSRWPGKKVTVLFEPRSNTTATNRFQDELGAAFAGASQVWVGPVYRAQAYAETVRLDRDRLVADIERTGARARYTDDVGQIVRHVRDDVGPDDIVLILSNGAFGGICDLIRAQFSEHKNR